MFRSAATSAELGDAITYGFWIGCEQRAGLEIAFHCFFAIHELLLLRPEFRPHNDNEALVPAMPFAII